MGTPSEILPENILRSMSLEDRASLGKAGRTAAEAGEVFERRVESEMHVGFRQWLALNCIPFVEARMDKRSTIRLGWPDFTLIFHGKVLLIEFKVPGGGLSQDQQEVKAHLNLTGTEVYVCESLEHAIQFTREILKP